MMTFLSRLTILSCAAGLGLSVAQADPETLAKARAFLGSEAALDAVTSLRFLGKLEILEKGEVAAAGAQLEIIFQKPDRQRITATNDTRVEVTALDGYDAWQRVSDSKEAGQWEVTLLGPEQIKRLRANTLENLSFYRDISIVGGHIEDRGNSTVDGVKCRKLAFVHGPGIVFTRSFDVSTGRLVQTETESGTVIREEGQLMAGGLRFPACILTTNGLPDGTSRTIRVTFSSVEVNPALDSTLFALPALTN